MCVCLIMQVVHGHGRGRHLGICFMVKPCVSCVMSLRHMCIFDYAGGAWAWTRQAHLHVPCGEAVCVVCRSLQHVGMQHLRRLPKAV